MAAKGKGLLAPVPQTRQAKKPGKQSKPKTPGKPKPAGKTQGQGLLSGAPQEIIDAAQRSNEQTARTNFNLNNRASESNPFGTRQTVLNPDGTTSESLTLEESQQRQLDAQNAREEGMQDFAGRKFKEVDSRYSSPYDLSGLKNDPNSLDFTAERARIEGDIYNRYKQDLDTQFSAENQEFERRMASQGIPAGSAQYNRLQQQMQQNQARAYQDARTQAVQSSGDEMTRSFGMAMDSRARAVDEYNMGRDRPYQELSNVMSGMNGPQMPNFQARGGTEVKPVDVEGIGTAQMGINQQANQNRWQSQQNALDRAAQARVASIGKSGGGFNIDQYKAQLQADTDAYAQRQAIQNQYRVQPKRPSAIGQAGAGIAAGIGQGLGAGLTNYFTK